MEQKLKSKRILVTGIVCALVALMTFISIIFAYLNQSIVRGFNTKIVSTNVTFLYNGQTYLDEIAGKNIDLAKGAVTKVDMTLEILGSSRVVVQYDVDFLLPDEEENPDAYALMRAIEVYRIHTNGGYDIIRNHETGEETYSLSDNEWHEYLGTLNNIGSFDFSDIMVTDFDEVIPLRFVYSAAASDAYYDHIAGNGNVDFSIKATARAQVMNEAQKYIFASNSLEFQNKFLEAKTGQTIILVGSDDDGVEDGYIKLADDLTRDGHIGIDLNGRNLKLNGKTLTMNYAEAEDDGAPPDASTTPHYPNYSRIGIIDRKGTGGIIDNGGLIKINGIKEVFLVSDVLMDKVSASGVIRITSSDSFSSAFDDFIDLLETRAESRFGTSNSKALTTDTDVSYIFENLKAYYKPGGFFELYSTIDNSVIEYNAGHFVIATDIDVTSKLNYGFIFVNLTYNISGSFTGYLTLRGNSAYSIAQAVLQELPHSITGSQFFRAYDSVTGANITWYVTDGFGGQLLDSNGLYRKGGLDRILSELDKKHNSEYPAAEENLANLNVKYRDREIEIRIKVSKSSSGAGTPVDAGEGGLTSLGEIYGKFMAVTVTAKERTILIYEDKPIIISAMDGEEFDINDYLTKLIEEEDKFYSAANLVRVEISNLKKVKANENDTSEETYLKVVDWDCDDTHDYEYDEHGAGCTERSFQKIALNGIKPPKNSLLESTFDLTFVYEVITVDAAGNEVIQERTYTIVKKSITVEGEFSEVTRYDMSYTLQIPFLSNQYLTGEDDWFYAYGALRPMVNDKSVPVICNYTPQADYSKFISITYDFVDVVDLYTPDDGSDITLSEQFAFFRKKTGTVNGIAGTTYYEYLDDIYMVERDGDGNAIVDDNGEKRYILDGSGNKIHIPVNADEIFERKAIIQILRTRITNVEEIQAYFNVKAFTVDWSVPDEYFQTDYSLYWIKGVPNQAHKDEEGALTDYTKMTDEQKADTANWVFVYKDPTTQNIRELKYIVSLQIMGIIRNDPAHVADTQLYNVYLKIFDLNGDGLISFKEANSWSDAIARYKAGKATTTDPYDDVPYIGEYASTLYETKNKVYYYINLSGLTVSSLKGVEYFKGVEGYDFTNSGRGSLVALESLSNSIIYLNLSTNSVTELTSLQFFDNLEYLNLQNNKITNIEPLRYLSKLTYLSFASTNSTNFNIIANYEPLTLMTNLQELVLTGMTMPDNTGIHNDPTTMYYLTLLKANCSKYEKYPDNSNYPVIKFTYGWTISITTEDMVAAQVMRDLEDINRVNQTLYMPTYYFYEDEHGDVNKYQLWWYVDKDENNLKLHYVEGDHVVKYTISNPIQDKPVTLYLKVYLVEGDLESYVSFQREFHLTLEASYSGEIPYIYNDLTGSYVLASELIPDEQLRARLFEMFNFYVEGDVAGFEGHSERFVISLKDIAYYKLNSVGTYDFSYSGIESLVGLATFTNVLKGVVNLVGNPFPSEHLSLLTFNVSTVTGLILGGYRYNFTDLIVKSGVATTNGLLIPKGLTMLNVSQCYGLDDEEVLSQLYSVYLSYSSLVIYIESSVTVWDPFAKTLSAAVHSLKTTATFAKKGDIVNIYTMNGGVASTGIPISVYGNAYNMVNSTSTTYSYFYYNQTGQYMTSSTSYYLYFASTGNITYSYSTATVVFPTSTIGTIRFQPNISVPRINNATNANTKTSTAIYYQYYYVQIFFQDMGELVDVYENGDENNNGTSNEYLGTLTDVVASYDLKYPVYRSLFAYFSVNWASRKFSDISKIYESAANFCIESGYTGTYVDYKGRFAVSTKLFSEAGFNTYLTETAVTINRYNDNINKKNPEGAFAGLQYFTKIVTANVYYDTDFGNGAGLQGIRTLNLYYMTVDFTTISTVLENLETINIQYFHAFYAGGADDSAFRYFPALKSLTLLYSTPIPGLNGTAGIMRYFINDFSFLLGAIRADGTSSLTSIRLYGYNGTGSVSTIGLTDENAEYVKRVYVAALKAGTSDTAMLYQVGSSFLHSDTGYFYAVYNGEETENKYGDIENWVAGYSGSQLVQPPTLSSLGLIWGSGVGASTSKHLDVDDKETADADFASLVTAMQDMELRYDYTKYNSYSDYLNDVGGVTTPETYWLDQEHRVTTDYAYYTNWTDIYGDAQTSREGLTPIRPGSSIYLPASNAMTYYGLLYGDDDEISRNYYIKWDVRVVYNTYGAGLEAAVNSGNLDLVGMVEEITFSYNGFTGEWSGHSFFDDAAELYWGDGTRAYNKDDNAYYGETERDYNRYLKLTLSNPYFANAYMVVIGTFLVATDFENYLTYTGGAEPEYNPTLYKLENGTYTYKGNIAPTAYMFMYEFKVGKGDGVYTYNSITDTGIRDLALRIWMFAYRNTYNYNKFKDSISAASFSSIAINVMSISATSTNNNVVSKTIYRECYYYFFNNDAYRPFDSTVANSSYTYALRPGNVYAQIGTIYGLDDLFTYWGLVYIDTATSRQASLVTSFLMEVSMVTDLSPLYCLTNLEILDLSGGYIAGTSYSYYFPNVQIHDNIYRYSNKTGEIITKEQWNTVITGGTAYDKNFDRINIDDLGAWRKLKTLDLFYCLSIDTVSLEYLALTPRASLLNLYLSYTRCMYTYDALFPLRTIVDNATTTSTQTINLALNYESGYSSSSATSNPVNLAMIESFLDLVDPKADYPTGIDKTYPLYIGGTIDHSKTSSHGILLTYRYAISTQMQSMLKNVEVSSEVKVKLLVTVVTATGAGISATNYRQIANVYMSDTNVYNPEKTLTFVRTDITRDVIKFGINGNSIDCFDSELIALLFYSYSSTFQVINGYYMYTGSQLSLQNRLIHTLNKVVNGVTYPVLTLLDGNTSSTVGNIIFNTTNTTYAAMNNGPAYNDSSSYVPKTGNSLTMTNSNFATNASMAMLLLDSFIGVGSQIVVTYVVGAQPTYTAKLPNAINFKGLRYDLNWGVGSTSSISDLSTNHNFKIGSSDPHPITRTIMNVEGDPTLNAELQYAWQLFYRDTETGYLYLIINSKTLPANETIVDDYFYIYCQPSRIAPSANNVVTTTSLTNQNKRINLTSKVANQTTSYDKYIEAKYDNGNIVLENYRDKNGSVSTRVLGVATDDPSQAGIYYQKLYKTVAGTVTTYYNYNSSGGAETINNGDSVLIDANYVFESPWLTNYLFSANNLYSGYTEKIILKEGGLQHGYILTAEDINKVEKLDIKYSTGTSSNANYVREVSSIEGVQIFYKMTSFIARTGTFADLSPLTGFPLKTFYYSPTLDATNATYYLVVDFSPLLSENGALHSLEYFTFSANGTTSALELNFLLDFTNLKEIYIASGYAYTYRPSYSISGINGITSYSGTSYVTYGLTYFMTPSGRYLLDALKSKGVYIYTSTMASSPYSAFYYVNTNFRGNGRTALTVDNNNYKLSNDLNNIAGYTTCYALTASNTDGFAYNVLKNFKIENNKGFNDVYYLPSENYKIRVNTAGLTDSTDSYSYIGGQNRYTVTFDLPATVAQGSGFYVINWESASAHVKINHYYLTRAITISVEEYDTLLGMMVTRQVTIPANVALSIKQLQQLADSVEYYNQYKAGITLLKTSVTASYPTQYEAKLYSDVRIIANITMNDYNYGRMFSIYFD